jgi:glycosyltransferase involved in cell wall biosynthesis
MNNKISVVVTTYNRPDLLKKCLISVFQQSKKPFEIILINNFPKPIKINDNKNLVKVYNLPCNVGIANGRNIGATLAKGDYLAFLDDDDLWPKSYIKRSENYIINHSPKILLSKIYVKDNSRLKLFKDPSGKINLKNILLMNPGITGSNIIINKKIFFKLNGYDPNLIPSEDKSICIDALINNIEIHIQNNYIIY